MPLGLLGTTLNKNFPIITVPIYVAGGAPLPCNCWTNRRWVDSKDSWVDWPDFPWSGTGLLAQLDRGSAF